MSSWVYWPFLPLPISRFLPRGEKLEIFERTELAHALTLLSLV
jgi:hypothetical protein